MDGFVVWLTGLPASGKTTTAKMLAERLRKIGLIVVVLDSDELRSVLTPKPRYSEEERRWFYSVIAWLANHLSKSGVNVIIAATGNRRAYRDVLRKQVGKFAEVYLKCPIKTCIERDVKGIYKLALEGRAKTVPGIQVPYEEPKNPELVIRTDKTRPNKVVEKVIVMFRKLGWL